MKVPTLAATDIDAGAPGAIEAFGAISANTRAAVAPPHIKVRIISPRQVGYKLRWEGVDSAAFKLHLGAMLEALKPARRLLTFRSTS
jgi:hypothetical protein